jgi:La domain
MFILLPFSKVRVTCILISNILYFFRENLSQDKYLLTQMDRDQWVPISIIAGFNQVRRLTYRVELVTEVLKGVYFCLCYSISMCSYLAMSFFVTSKYACECEY